MATMLLLMILPIAILTFQGRFILTGARFITSSAFSLSANLLTPALNEMLSTDMATNLLI